MPRQRQGSELVLSFIAQRRVIGVLGVSLPLVVMIGGWQSSGQTVRDSVSAYYHSNMRDFFVGVLAMTGIFLMSYRGHDRRDRILTFFSGLFALGVATFPTIRTESGPAGQATRLDPLGVFALPGETSRIVHYLCAVALFACLTGMCYQFTHSTGPVTRQKTYRNVVYWICAGLMVAAIATGGIFLIPGIGQHKPDDLILIVEAACLGAFGVSWLVKGETFLSDDGSVATRVSGALRASRLYKMLGKQAPPGALSP